VRRQGGLVAFPDEIEREGNMPRVDAGRAELPQTSIRIPGLGEGHAAVYEAQMRTHKSDHLEERLNAAANAKQALLEKFRARPAADDPVVLERRAVRVAVGIAREARASDRKLAREAEASRLAAEQATQAANQAAREAERAARQAEEAALALVQEAEHQSRATALAAEKKERTLSLAAEQKAIRDARYAARKARRR
jgi:hypothetical protein